MSRRIKPFFLLAGLLASTLTCGAGTPASGRSIAPALVPSARYALAAPPTRVTVQIPGVDRAKELLADGSPSKSRPLRYAVTRSISTAAFNANHSIGGEWRDLPDGMTLWRVPLHAANARSLDFGFRRFFLPPGAQLFIHNAGQTLGPYTDADNRRSRNFFTPLIRGDSAQIEVLLPKAMKRFLDLELSTVHVGYRDIFAPSSFSDPQTGSGACNIDTICPQGDIWRSEINAAAILVFDGGFCTGELVNNTRGDFAPLLATATHCIASQPTADSLVLYWKYESPTCRVVGSSENSLPISSEAAIAHTGGAQLLAVHADSDVTLLQLNSAPPSSANVYFNGWDIGSTSFDDPVVIHHPSSDAKRISFGAGTVTVDDQPIDEVGTYHWRVDHYSQGTTEAGSSGSGLLDINHHLRGVLSAGEADCSNPAGEDYYGRFETAWQGGGTPDTRLRDWLDPTDSGVSTLDGSLSCTPPSVSLDISDSSTPSGPMTAGDKLQLTATASGGAPPYQYAFDVDNDGITDSTDPSQSSIPAVYPGAYADNISVAVTDSAGCTGVASRALIVQAPQIAASGPAQSSSALCGAAPSGAINPGQRLRSQVTLSNTGSAASQAGYAIFAQHPATLGQTKLTLETPSIALPALAPGQSTIVNLDYAIDSGDSCGAPVTIDYLGSADVNSFIAANSTVVDSAIAGSCEAVTTCPAVTTTLRLDSSSYFDARRPGTGITLAAATLGQTDPTVFAVWFTGDAARQPTWYVLQNFLQGNQVNTPLVQTQQSAMPIWPAASRSIGAAQITVVDTDTFVFTWNIGATFGGNLYTPVTTLPSSIRVWYNPSESGWGIYDQLVQTGGPDAPPLIASFVYMFDDLGTPRWLQASSEAYQLGDVENAVSPRPTCVGCVWLDYSAGLQPAGTLTYGGTPGNALVSTNLLFPAAVSGSWVRNQFPLNSLYSSP